MMKSDFTLKIKDIRASVSIYLLALIMVAGACKKSGEDTVAPEETEPTKVERLVFTKRSLSLSAGDTATLKISVLPTFSSDKALEWKSANSNVATVSAEGKVTAVGRGKTYITATAKDGSGLSSTIRVAVDYQFVSDIALSMQGGNRKLDVGEQVSLVAAIQPAEADEKALDWTSSDPAIITVDENGTVTAIGTGKAVITAVATDESMVSNKIEIEVNPVLVSNITLSTTTINFTQKTQSETLTATILPAGATNKVLEWSSSDLTVATVQDGVVRPAGSGTATITAKATDGSNVTATAIVTSNLPTFKIEAEDFTSTDASQGVRKETNATNYENGQGIGSIRSGKFALYENNPVNDLRSFDNVDIRAQGNGSATTPRVEVRVGNSSGALLTTINLTADGKYAVYSAQLDATAKAALTGSTTICLVFRNSGGTWVCNADWIRFR
ncbi:Ig-like domain-containing protein [Desertivirga xinjiangensis]|uniref:Ig-like domain-containing protein n=1 Tax=Desertivirga xinjiangensis TaxID=539206 RepID=UPI00210D6CFA|nr:Ig-like domain-containing protein [Pedobacter xinjiangensis]